MKNCFAIALLATLMAGQAQAAPTLIDWTDEGGSIFFNGEAITGFSFEADQLTDVIDNSLLAGIAIDTDISIFGPDPSETIYLDLRLNGAWTNIWSDTFKAPDFIAVANIFTPINFAHSTVSGIRFRRSSGLHIPLVQTFNFFGDVKFEFNDSTAEAPPGVPEPGSMALLACGSLGLIGGAVRRRRAAKAAAAA